VGLFWGSIQSYGKRALAVGLVCGLIHGYEERVGRGIDLGIGSGLWEESGAEGLICGFIQGYGERAGQWE